MQTVLLPYSNVTYPSYHSDAVYRCSVPVENPNHSTVYEPDPWIALEIDFMATVQPQKPDPRFIASLQNTSAEIIDNLPHSILDLLKSPELGGILALTVVGLAYTVAMLLLGLLWCCYRCLCYKNSTNRPKRSYYGATLDEHTFNVRGDDFTGSIGAGFYQWIQFCEFFGTAAAGGGRRIFRFGNLSQRHRATHCFCHAPRIYSNAIRESGAVIGDLVLARLRELGIVDDIYSMVLLSQNATVVVSPLILDINTKIQNLSSEAVKLEGQLEDLTESLTESDCPDTCAIIGPLARQLKINVDLTTFNMDVQMSRLNSMLSGGFQNSTEEGYAELLDLPSIIQNKSSPTRTETLEKVHHFGQDLDHYLAAVDNFTNPLLTVIDNQSDNIDGYATIVHSYGSSAHTAVIVVGILLLVISSVTLAGCLWGGIFFDPVILPTRRSGKVTYGGCSLMCAVYTILIIAWILMIITTIMFVIGTQMDAFLCPLLQGTSNNFTFLDQVVEIIENTTRDGKPITIIANETLRPGNLLMRCMKNSPLYGLLNLGLVFDVYDVERRLEKFNISGVLEGLKVTIHDVIIFSPQSDSLANDFLTALSANFSSYLQELNTNKSLVAGNLTAVRKALSESTGTNDYISRNIILIDRIDTHVHAMDVLRASLATEIILFQSTAQYFQEETRHILEKSRIAQRFMENDATNFVFEIAQEFGDEIYEIAKEFVAYVVVTVVDKIGPCRPLYDAVTAVANLLCSNLIKSLNGLWLALGLGLFICVPIMFCNCHLAKYYSRAQNTNSDVDIKNQIENNRPVLHNPFSNVRKVRPAPAVITVQVAAEPQPSFGRT
ncbi:prominin-1-A-like isoform X2 [Paramacrobiotus metropolitanus]|uniref:prominin-1-A-like isoform X2 n=1 Tax=Paramacrobiotus metropolitanus TaxID=2943436 RepID=UPI002445C85C|nr:prominin-1-A-like isoform X2 [Paramacrobiotus metropolitanus]